MSSTMRRPPPGPISVPSSPNPHTPGPQIEDLGNSLSSGSLDSVDSDPPDHRLSFSSKIFLAALSLLFLVWGLLASFASALALPLLLLPLLGCVVWWSRNRDVMPLDMAVSAYVKGVSPMAALTFAGELLFAFLLFAVITGAGASEGASQDWTRDSITGWTGVAVLLLALASTVEEAVKYRLCLRAENIENQVRFPAGREKLVMLGSMMCGFASGLGIFLCFFYSILLSRAGVASESLTRQALTLATVSLLGSLPLHVLSGYGMAVRLVLHEQFNHTYTRGQILGPPAVARFVCSAHLMFCWVGLYMTPGSAGWWLVTLIPTTICAGVMGRWARKAEALLPREYMSRVGTLMGYGLLDAAEPVSPRAIIEQQRTRRVVNRDRDEIPVSSSMEGDEQGSGEGLSPVRFEEGYGYGSAPSMTPGVGGASYRSSGITPATDTTASTGSPPYQYYPNPLGMGSRKDVERGDEIKSQTDEKREEGRAG